jgi:hypothetical protein
VGSVEQYELVFGPTTGGDGRLGRSVRGYLDNGGELAWVLRLSGARTGDEPYGEVKALLDQPQVALLVLPDLWGDLGSDPAGGAPAAVGRIARDAHASLDRLLVLDLPKEASRSASEVTRSLALLDRALDGPQARAVRAPGARAAA